jgi:carboxyl-terminal processing protease
VADGGGISPDWAIEPQELSNITQSLLTKQLIFDYATDYRSKNPTIAPAKSFKLTDAAYDSFVAWLSDKEYDYVTKSEKSLDQLKEIAIKEEYFDGMKQEFEALKKTLMHDKEADLKKFKPEIMELLQDEIASRYYYQKGRIENSFGYDPDITKAVEALRDKAVFDKIMAKGPDINRK